MNHRQVRKLIRKTLKKMNMWSEDAEELVFLTGLVESGYKYITQIGSGIARSFFQVEAFTAKDSIDNYLSYRKAVLGDFAFAIQRSSEDIMSMSEEDFRELLWHDIAAGIAFCRIKYRRVPKAIPSDLNGLAKYWKDYYNTEKGAGTVKHFLDMEESRQDK